MRRTLKVLADDLTDLVNEMEFTEVTRDGQIVSIVTSENPCTIAAIQMIADEIRAHSNNQV